MVLFFHIFATLDLAEVPQQLLLRLAGLSFQLLFTLTSSGGVTKGASLTSGVLWGCVGKYVEGQLLGLGCRFERAGSCGGQGPHSFQGSFFLENHQKPLGNGDRFLKRTVAENKPNHPGNYHPFLGGKLILSFFRPRASTQEGKMCRRDWRSCQLQSFPNFPIFDSPSQHGIPSVQKARPPVYVSIVQEKSQCSHSFRRGDSAHQPPHLRLKHGFGSREGYQNPSPLQVSFLVTPFGSTGHEKESTHFNWGSISFETKPFWVSLCPLGAGGYRCTERCFPGDPLRDNRLHFTGRAARKLRCDAAFFVGDAKCWGLLTWLLLGNSLHFCLCFVWRCATCKSASMAAGDACAAAGAGAVSELVMPKSI